MASRNPTPVADPGFPRGGGANPRGGGGRQDMILLKCPKLHVMKENSARKGASPAPS